MKTNFWRIFAAAVILAGVALGIRLAGARQAYPASGDAGHFVQYGVALAHGVPGALSTYWSQGMVVLAAGAVKMGWDPRYAMQATTVVAGVGMVLLFAGIVGLLTRSPALAFAGGLVVATNPTMVHYSITGYSEMSYMAFLLAGVCLGLSRRLNPLLRYALAGALIGAGGYFKGLDAAVAAFGFSLFVLLRAGKDWKKHWMFPAGILAAAFLVLLPLCVFTYAQAGKFTPGSKGWAHFAGGPDWADSKQHYAAGGSKLYDRTWPEVARALPRRAPRNVADAARIFNEQMFWKGFRIGTVWFSLGLIGIGILLWKKKRREALLPLCLLGFQVGLTCLAYVDRRNLVPSLPWVFLLVFLAWPEVWPAESSRARRWLSGLILLVFISVNARYAVHAFRSEFVWWRYANIEACAKALKAHGGTDEDVVMNYGPHLAVEFNQTNPLKWVEVPFGTIAQVEEVAQRHQVRFVVVSDAFRAHWPVARLFDKGVSAPENWILREELAFPADETTGRVAEKCRIYERRSPAGPTEGT